MKKILKNIDVRKSILRFGFCEKFIENENVEYETVRRKREKFQLFEKNKKIGKTEAEHTLEESYQSFIKEKIFLRIMTQASYQKSEKNSDRNQLKKGKVSDQTKLIP